MFTPDMRTPNCEKQKQKQNKKTAKQTNKKLIERRFIYFQMFCMRKSLLFTLAVTLITVSLTKQDCSSCCHGKWNACFTGCETMEDCDSQCNIELNICQNGCPGSCSVINPRSFRKQNLISDTRSTNGSRKLTRKWRLNKLLKKLQRRSGS